MTASDATSVPPNAPSIDLEEYERRGYVLIDAFDEGEVRRLRNQLEALLGKGRKAPPREQRFHASDFQHLGDRLEDYGELTKHYYFHLLTDERTLPIHWVFHHPRILSAVEALIGGDLIINNASLFAAEPGTEYRLGWHRDVIQIPQDQIVPEAIYSPRWFHNNVQINLPLYRDEALWVVPGSHRRPNTPEEDRAFRGSRHYAPPGAEMPGAVRVTIESGQAVLYNNNLIHRGHHPRFERPRLALHVGYHSRTRPPTWHFYLLDERRFTDEYRRRMSPRMRQMLEDYFACRREFPRMQDTWPTRAEPPESESDSSAGRGKRNGREV